MNSETKETWIQVQIKIYYASKQNTKSNTHETNTWKQNWAHKQNGQEWTRPDNEDRKVSNVTRNTWRDTQREQINNGNTKGLQTETGNQEK